MRIVVYGVGAVGGYFGGRLAQSGAPVFFVARGATLHALRTHGLRVESTKGDFQLQRLECGESLAEAGKIDCILLCVKAWQVPAIAAQIAPHLSSDGFVLPLQNGIEAPSQIAEAIGAAKVLGGLTRIYSHAVAPGHIKHAGVEPAIVFGELTNEKSQRVLALRSVIEAAGIRAEIPDNIHLAMWEKFLFIATMSGAGAVTRAPIGVLRSIPETRTLLEAALREILQVGGALGIPFAPDTIEQTFRWIDHLPAEGTASMQRDMMDGRPSELENQNGAVVRLGAKAGVPTPVHEFFYRTLLPLEMRSRGAIKF